MPGPQQESKEALCPRITRHMAGRVRATAVDNVPFPHIVVRDFFPPDVYREMLRLLPGTASYEAFSYEKHQTSDGASNRLRFKMESRNIERLGESAPLWFAVRDALGSPELKAAVFDQLRDALAYRFGIPVGEVAGLSGFPLPELFRETDGYRIKPHPDTRKKVVTMQIALPPDGSQTALGTEFYRRSFHPRNLLRDPKGFEVVKRVPFLPNVAYAFCVLNTIAQKSWHGRSQLPAGCGVRNTILNIYYQDAAQANPDLVEHVRRAA